MVATTVGSALAVEKNERETRRADVTANTIISDATSSLRILSRALCSPHGHLTAGNHLQWNRLFVRHCNENLYGLAFEAESHRVGSHGLNSNRSRNSSHNHGGD